MTRFNDRHELLESLQRLLSESRRAALKAVNAEMLRAYWEMGKALSQWEETHGGSPDLLEGVAADLASDFGKAFSGKKLAAILKFFKEYENRPPLFRFREESDLAESGLRSLDPGLSWSHYTVMMDIEDSAVRDEVERKVSREGWTASELEKQLWAAGEKTSDVTDDMPLFEERTPPSPEDYVVDPHVQAFMGIPDRQRLTESILERALLDHLQRFLLESGKELYLVERQKKMELKGGARYIDLVFYSRSLHAFFLVELVCGDFSSEDEEKLSLVLEYMSRESALSDENPPAALLIAVSRTAGRMKYLFASKERELEYRRLLPSEDQLAVEIQREQVDILKRYPHLEDE